MKSSKLLIGLGLAITLVAGMGLALGGCVTESTNLKKPASSYSKDQEAVRQVIVQSQDAWNKKDAEAYLAFFSDDAQIMVGKERRVVTKTAYKKMLPSVFKHVGEVRHESFDLKVDNQGRTAEVDLVVSNSGKTGDIIWLTKKVLLAKRGGRWLITESTFNVYFKGDTDPRERRKGPIPGEKLDES